ncbi:MAG: DNA-processing protein DprA [Holosporales bacterium]|nr:DNA-processing protein DprA [Holosporales bacterium]
MDIEEKIPWIRLAISKGIGPITFWNLLKKANGSAKNALNLVDEISSEEAAEDLLIQHNKSGFCILTAYEKYFPQKLKLIKDCPPILSVKGNLELLNKRSIAIVGARNASLLGKIFALKIAKSIGTNGFAVVSGMARGIDCSAHEGSIETGTIAIFAGGLDIIYPPENANLCDSILKNKGVIISEMMPGTPIDPSLFPRRNRIIAGVSEGVVLIEAAIKSGSLITAKFALEQGKEVFAVPGNPSDPRSKGCNLLIKQGAVLVDSVEDILSCFNLNSPKVEQIQESVDIFPIKEDTLSLKTSILSELSTTPISIEILFQHQNCGLPNLLVALGELEAEGKIRRYANSEVSLL